MPDLLFDLGEAVLLPRDELLALIRSAPYRYKVFSVPKRKPGQFRTIAQPAKEVKALQYWVMKHVLNQFRPHASAMAYRRGRSIAHNARPHARGRFLLKLDFKDFFPSIKPRDFKAFLRQRAVDFDDFTVEALCRILFWKPKGLDLRLSIGAPSSPLLSNLLMYEFDRRITAVCKAHAVRYTRYADDLSFSAVDSIRLATVEREALNLCARLKTPLLTLNEDKTVRRSKRDARRITGLTLTNDRKVSLGRDTKRRISASVHHFVTNRLDEQHLIELRGTLAFANSVEPEFLARLRNKYGADAIKRCFEGR